MTVTSDPSITRGGCLLETPYGDVDARIETQFDMIHQSLESAYMERGDD
jgi:flagellar assembly protein FliH